MIEEKLTFKSGTTSTKQVRLSLIPHAGLVNAAKRFELGLERHGDKAWNALSSNQEALKDQEWLIERCSHIIEHAYSIIDFLTHKTSDKEKAIGDAGAIAWGGLVLGEAFCKKIELIGPPGNFIPRVVANNLDNTKCIKCNEIFKAGQSIFYGIDGTFGHVKCPSADQTKTAPESQDTAPV